MTSPVTRLVISSLVALAFAGCAAIPTQTSEPVPTTGETVATENPTADPAAPGSPAETVSQEPPAEAVASSSATYEAPRTAWRPERESGAATNPDAVKLIEQLNDASRELATLRATNAKLRVEQSSYVSPAAPRVDPADEKLAANLKSYAQFKQEVVTIFAEMDRMRKEHDGLSSNLKTAVEQADQARAAMIRIDSELRAERRMRLEAEQAAAKVEDQLRAIARALSNAGLSVDKLADSPAAGGRREGGSSR